MMKKLIGTIAVLMSIALLFTACGAAPAQPAAPSNDSGTTAAQSQAPAGGTVTLDFYYWDEIQKPGMDAMTALFMKENPDIKINSTIIPWDQYWTKMQTSLPAGGAPDVFWINRNITDYAKAGLLMDISDKITQDKVDLTPFPETATSCMSVDGKLWAIPKDFDTIALYYNKSMFDKAGVKYPDDTWTLDTLRETAKKLTIPGQQYGYAPESSIQVGEGNFVYASGGVFQNPDGSVPSVDTAPFKTVLQFMVDCMYKDKVSPTAAELTESTYDVQFQSEKVAMITDGSWQMPVYYDTLKDKLGVAPIPKVGDNRACFTGSLGFAGNAKTKYPDQVWKFLKFTATKEAQEATATVVIPAYKGAADVWTKQFPSVDAKVFLDAIEYAHRLPVYSKNSAAVNNAYEAETQNIYAQSETVDEGLAAAAKNMQAAYNK